MSPRDEDLPRWRLPGMRVRIDLLAVTVLGVALFAAYSVHLKKDVGWDFRNYHYYGCYCLENGRIGFDISAAQLQSYLNPVAYLPYCWAVDHLKPLAVGILFGALAGLNLGLLYQLSFAALAGIAPRRRVWLALLTAAAGVWSPFFRLLIGSSFTESWTPLLVLLALLALLRDAESPSGRLVFAAGLALGAAMGFKLVNGVFALALLLTIGTTFRRAGFFRRVAVYSAGAALALLLVAGPWAFTLQREFGSPLFPFYNAIFKSPYAPAVNIADARWQVTTLAGALDRPFHWAAAVDFVSSEFPFRDLRFAIFAILLLPALAVSLRREKSANPEAQPLFNPAHRSLLLWFFTLSYLLWLYGFGVMRYAVPLELLSSLAILALCDCLIANRGAKQRVFVVLALLGIAWGRVTELPRPDWGQTWFETTIPRELRAAHALYVMPDSAGSAYIVPMLPADSRFVRLNSNASILEPDRYLGPRALSLIKNHSGPLRVLEGDRFDIEALSAFGLSVNLDDCLTLHTFADQFNFCSAYRTADGVHSTVPLVHAPLAAQQAAAIYHHELLANQDFMSGLTHWEMGGAVEVLPQEHAVRVTEHSHLHQLVPVTPGAPYRLVVRARCPQPGTYTRLQVNWVDKSGRALPAYLNAIGCTSQWADYAAVVNAPANAAAGHFYVTADAELPVLIQHVSMAW